jgi:hypothetical protein
MVMIADATAQGAITGRTVVGADLSMAKEAMAMYLLTANRNLSKPHRECQFDVSFIHKYVNQNGDELNHRTDIVSINTI